MDKNFRDNHEICLCCRESKHKKYEDAAKLCEDISLEVSQMDLLDACGIGVQYRATLKVAGFLEFDEVESCDIHDGDKLVDQQLENLQETEIKKL